MKRTTTKLMAFLLCLALSLQTVFAMAPVSEGPIVVKTGDPVTSNPVVQNALHEFKTLSKAERKVRLHDAKKAMKAYKHEQKAGKEPSTNTLLLVILALLLPPLAVYLHEGEINNKFWIDLVLTLLFFIPGVIYALIVVLGAD